MLVTMSDKELVRAQVIQSVCEKRLRRCDAASQRDLSKRQVQQVPLVGNSRARQLKAWQAGKPQSSGTTKNESSGSAIH